MYKFWAKLALQYQKRTMTTDFSNNYTMLVVKFTKKYIEKKL